jgi:hypothetical protein
MIPSPTSTWKLCRLLSAATALALPASAYAQQPPAQAPPPKQSYPGSVRGEATSSPTVLDPKLAEQTAEEAKASPAPQPPAYQDLRYLENWGVLRDPALRGDPLDRIKYIPLGNSGAYTSIGGELRARFDYIRNPTFYPIPEENVTTLLQRYMFHADTHFNKNVRLFTQFASAFENGKKFGPWPTDENTAEIRQAFMEFGATENPARSILVRVGRQELAFGQSHFISPGDFFNTRRSFDGVRLQAFRNSLEFNAFFTKPVQINQGAFDDSPEHRQTFYAASVFANNPITRQGRTAVFYIGLDNKMWCWQRGCGRDQRHTLGLRILGTRENLDYVYEYLNQWGTFQESTPIRAWAVTTDTGYTFPRLRFYPRFGVRMNATSGDKGGSLGTFNPIFPDHAYSGRIGLIGPSNNIDITPNARLALTRRIYFIPDMAFFWRTSTRDGIYGIASPYLATPAGSSRKRYIGTHISLPTQFVISRHLTYTIGFTHFFAGAFIQDLNPPGRSVTFLTTFLTYRF